MVFGNLWIDIVVVAGCGFIGGMGLSFLQEKGIEWPHLRKEKDENDLDRKPYVVYWDAGFLAEALVGLIAAIILYTLNQPSGQSQLIATGLTAGLGGAGILKGFIEKGKKQEAINLADQQASNNQQMTALMRNVLGDPGSKMEEPSQPSLQPAFYSDQIKVFETKAADINRRLKPLRR